MKFRLDNITTLKKALKELSIGLINLSFRDNFDSFKEDFTLAAGGTVSIRNRVDVVPTEYIVVKNTGDGAISRSTPWDENYLTFKNNGSIQADISVRIFR